MRQPGPGQVQMRGVRVADRQVNAVFSGGAGQIDRRAQTLNRDLIGQIAARRDGRLGKGVNRGDAAYDMGRTAHPCDHGYRAVRCLDLA